MTIAKLIFTFLGLITVAGAPPQPAPGPVGLVLEPTTVVSKQTATIVLRNMGPKEYRYYFEGGSNGCALPIYDIMVHTADGRTLTDRYDGPGRGCTMAIVPPRWVILKPGETMRFQLNTAQYFYEWGSFFRDPSNRRPKTHLLPVGTHTVTVSGGGISVSAKLIVTK